MRMYNPPHPGQFIKATYMDPFNLSARYIAKYLGVAPSTLNRLINGQNAVSPEMAYRLSIVLGRTPESWLSMQAQYDLWVNYNKTKYSKLKHIDFDHLDAA